MNWFYVLYLLNQNAYRYNNNHDDTQYAGNLACGFVRCISSACASVTISDGSNITAFMGHEISI